ncbi:MAG: class E sortase [Solirubrobacteraceae bacterium]|nr:class E sortase [Solirubrobacteraceae bacterium]
MTRRQMFHQLGTVLVVAGALLLADAVATIVWQEPISAIYTGVTQDALAGDLAELEQAKPTVVESKALDNLVSTQRRIAFLGRSLRRSADPGEAIGRIKAKKASIDNVIVDGTDPADLRKGPGLYESTAYPGVGGTTGIAGHRTTYGAPFRHIDRLNPGDTITVEMPYGKFTYRVQQRKIVPPTAVDVVKDVGYDRIVLTACHPLYSAEKRMVVFARQIDAQPRGAARGGKVADLQGGQQARTLGGSGLKSSPPR